MKACPLALVAAVTAMSCATVVNGSRQSVSLNSEPPRAEVTVFNRDGKEVYRGNTPTTITVPRGSSYFRREVYTLAFVVPDRDPMVVKVPASVDGWYFGNIVLGGAIGLLIIDPLTGAMFELPDEVAANLADRRITRPADTSELAILTVADLPPAIRQRIVPLSETAQVAASASSPADAPAQIVPATATRADPRPREGECTVDMLLQLKNAGLSDAAIKRACE